MQKTSYTDKQKAQVALDALKGGKPLTKFQPNTKYTQRKSTNGKQLRPTACPAYSAKTTKKTKP
ncbi:hypothetical protein COZ78_02320 [bacterium (Candidatus Gribaldobacteria) CG_4_8_14_3_um_filter_42_11]|uniref:Uncharacterized protein n=3 Tax=Candidatus Gribaldobacteria TaxID=2798536 RepID=A0A2H0UVL0_9BACT|nr:MAG: hypothetical protein AUJ36_02730 [Parcubacteria group bacterium CG1_02_41_26]PIR90847.1 MAG: hypothetical protein COU03_03835 [bacterium (Candidatus Gribaldobacteria) CG10_big_fil_rev_8_21_14_0_10_41_12]PIV47007.1 MAG: hypothetical protein COS21_02245 [bacterium (Candidatus Gribaldobacteria) CG02_land_8_20_14_3_00_41_15]PIX03077.1 MAG: hypothetical protein COZ78_02320 [bacterium (Candidatus Gribaldobacteria) CG_4_8_14_3_um_filter_42_11]